MRSRKSGPDCGWRALKHRFANDKYRNYTTETVTSKIYQSNKQQQQQRQHAMHLTVTQQEAECDKFSTLLKKLCLSSIVNGRK